MDRVLLLLKIFIVVTLASHTISAEYIDILKSLVQMAEDNLNRSSSNNKSPNKYFVILNSDNDGLDVGDLGDTSDGAAYPDIESVRRQAHGKERFINKREEQKKANLVKEQHVARMAHIIHFMEKHYMTTVYLFNEVERIKKKREVMDKLRRMVFYLEQPGNEAVKDIVMKCYQNERVAENFEVDVWKGHTPNNLIINILKDPENDGVAN